MVTRTERTIDNAPEVVRAVGGLALSLWMTGANYTDVCHVARLEAAHGEAVELLHEVANAGVVADYPCVGYVEVQIDRVTWNELAPRRRPSS